MAFDPNHVARGLPIHGNLAMLDPIITCFFQRRDRGTTLLFDLLHGQLLTEEAAILFRE
jgi:hypothetical protein